MPNAGKKSGYSKKDLREVSDNPELTKADFAKARPFSEVFADLRSSVRKERGKFIVKFDSPSGQTAVIIEDDGRVGYAYMLDGDGQIRSDVWLYNRGQTPTEPEWHDPTNAPFANPAPVVDESSLFCPPDSIEDVFVEWIKADQADVAKVYLFRKYFAKLIEGAQPGWSLLAAKDGPLARVLNEPG